MNYLMKGTEAFFNLFSFFSKSTTLLHWSVPSGFFYRVQSSIVIQHTNSGVRKTRDLTPVVSLSWSNAPSTPPSSRPSLCYNDTDLLSVPQAGQYLTQLGCCCSFKCNTLGPVYSWLTLSPSRVHLCSANVLINFPLKSFSVPLLLLYFLHSTSHYLKVS